MTVVVFLSSLFGFMAFGMPIAFALILTGAVLMWYLDFWDCFSLLDTHPQSAAESAAETKSSVTRRLPTRSTNGRRVRARPAVAERIGARNGTGGAVLQEIMRLDTHFWARRVWVDLRKPSC